MRNHPLLEGYELLEATLLFCLSFKGHKSRHARAPATTHLPGRAAAHLSPQPLGLPLHPWLPYDADCLLSSARQPSALSFTERQEDTSGKYN